MTELHILGDQGKMTDFFLKEIGVKRLMSTSEGDEGKMAHLPLREMRVKCLIFTSKGDGGKVTNIYL